MATKSEVKGLAEQLSKGLQLDSDRLLANMEEKIYTATPRHLQILRRRVLRRQSSYKLDDEGLVKRIVDATKPRKPNGAGDEQPDFSCFQNQIMMPTVIDAFDQMPEDLQSSWLCIVCPEGDRVLVVASHKSTRVFDMEGTWICEHDSHLPAGSPSNVSKVDADSECTILDCLYNNEHEIYYVVDVLCWKGTRYYKNEANVRITTILEKLKSVPSLKQVAQSNPFRFFSLPVSHVCQKQAICSIIARASFEITGLLLYHKKAMYLRCVTPLGLWVETSCIPAVMDIQVHKLEYSASSDTASGRRDWRKNRYEMTPEQCSSVHNSAYAASFHTRPYNPQAFGPMRAPYPPYPSYGPVPPFSGYAMGYGDYSDRYSGYQRYPQAQRHYSQGSSQYVNSEKAQKKKKKRKAKQTKEASQTKDTEKTAGVESAGASVE